MKVIHEYVRISYFFTDPNFATDVAVEVRGKVWNENSKDTVSRIADELETLTEQQFTDSENVSQILNKFCEKEKIKMGKLFPLLRYALTASHIGAAVPETIAVLGRSQSLARLRSVQ